jgi:hypothetical protein
MEERGRRECAGTRLLRERDGKADMKELVECRGLRLRITAGEAGVLRRRAEQLRAHLREAQGRAVVAVQVADR